MILLLVVVVAVTSTVNALAQRLLTLEESVELAIDRSTTVGISRETLQSSRQSILSSYGSFLPNLSLGFNAGRNFVGPSQGILLDANGRPIDQSGFEHEQYSFSLNSNMMLFNWGVNKNNLQASKRRAEASEYDLQYQKDIATALVIRQFYELAKQKDLLEVQDESVAAARRNLEQVEAFYRIGSNTRADVLQARVNLGNRQLELITARNNVELAKARLASTLNIPLTEDIDVTGAVDDMSLVEPDFEAEVAYMLDHRAELLGRRKVVDAAEHRVSAAQYARYPTLSGALSYGWNDRVFPDNANFFKNDYSWFGGVALNWNIFDRFQTKSQIIDAKAQERIADYNFQQAKLDAVLEVKQIITIMREAAERMRVSQDQVEQAEENLRLAEERYRVGAGTQLETIDAGVALTTAQSSLVTARVDYLTAKADLLRATGKPVKAN